MPEPHFASSIETALIVGVAGQVGGALARDLGLDRIAGTTLHTTFPDATPYDLTTADDDDARRLIEQTRPSVVFIAAGLTHVDKCETDPELADAVNRVAPGRLAGAARAAGARTVLYSSEYVFDGASGPYDEDDEPRPVSVYGRSKLAGEAAVLERDPDAIIIRTTVVYGPEQQGKNFAQRLMINLAAGRRATIPDDQLSSPTYNPDLARCSIALVEAAASGVFNVVGPEVMDRCMFARRLARAAGLDESLVSPIPTSSLGQTAARPLAAGLLIDKLRRTIPETLRGTPLRTVEDALADWRGQAEYWPLEVR